MFLEGSFVTKDFTPFQNMTKLQRLQIYNGGSQGRGPESFRGLEKLTNLRELYLNGAAGANLRDTSPLASLTKLTTLNLSGSYEEGAALDLSGISVLTSLQELRVEGKIVSLEPLRGLTSLRTVQMYNASDYNKPIQSLEPFSGLTRLRTLNLSYVAEGADTTPVSQVTELNIDYR